MGLELINEDSYFHHIFAIADFCPITTSNSMDESNNNPTEITTRVSMLRMPVFSMHAVEFGLHGHCH